MRYLETLKFKAHVGKRDKKLNCSTDYGALMADMFYMDGAELPISRFIQPRLECKIGFVIGRRLKGPNRTILDMLSAMDYVVPAAGIVHGRARWIDPETERTRNVLDSIVDNAGNAALIIGGRPMRPMDLDLRCVAAPNVVIRKYLNDHKVPQIFATSGIASFGDHKCYPWTIAWQPTFEIEGQVFTKYIL
jgi:2-keto-4-pentenoate hydratase